MSTSHAKKEGKVFLPYELAMGDTLTKFFDSFLEEKIMGTRCKICKRVLVAPRGFCPICFEPLSEWVEVGTEGVIENFAYVLYEFYGMDLKPPFVLASIRLDKADTSLMHQIGGFDVKNFNEVMKRVKLGGRVKAVWRKEKQRNIYDISHFLPIG
jgi:uncharacterized protein